MKINTDVAFVTGASHKICQDYARKGDGYILLSDGCSGSVDTDFGSRLLVKIAERFVRPKDRWSYDTVWKEILLQAKQISENLDLPDENIDATLLSAQVFESQISINIFGDGYIFVKHNDGNFTIQEIIFPSGYPYYYTYTCNEERRKLIKQTYLDSKMPFKVHTIYELDKDLKICQIKQNDILFEEDDNLNGISQFWNIKDIDTIAIMSDGVNSFYDKTTRTMISPIEIIKELCAFKNTNGEAVHRRLNAFLRNAEKKNWVHDDDVSLGAIFVEKE